MIQIDKARAFALKAHGNQKYGDEPYIVHLNDVLHIILEYGFSINSDVATAAYLHDTLEDTTTNYADLKKEFGVNVAEIVYCVTDELGRNRKERHQKTYPKTAQNAEAIIVKLADRIANTRRSLKDKDKLEMYKKEYAFFRQTLWNNNTLTEKMWEELDRIYGLS